MIDTTQLMRGVPRGSKVEEEEEEVVKVVEELPPLGLAMVCCCCCWYEVVMVPTFFCRGWQALSNGGDDDEGQILITGKTHLIFGDTLLAALTGGQIHSFNHPLTDNWTCRHFRRWNKETTAEGETLVNKHTTFTKRKQALVHQKAHTAHKTAAHSWERWVSPDTG